MVAAAKWTGQELELEDLLARGGPLEGHSDNLAACLAGGVCLTWDGRIARIADSLPLTAGGGHPRGEGDDRRGPTRAARRESRTPTPPSTSPGLRSSAPGSRAGMRPAHRRASPTGCTSRTGPRALLDAVRAELPPGAVGATLSGSGPTVIVWAEDAGACAAELEGRFPEETVMQLAVSPRGGPLKLPWDVELGEPFFAPYSKLVAPVRLPDGTEAVLKMAHGRRHRERLRARGAPVLGRHGTGPADRPRPGDARDVDRALRSRGRRSATSTTRPRWRSRRARWSGSGVSLRTMRPGRRLQATQSAGPASCRSVTTARSSREALAAIRELAPTQERLVLCHQGPARRQHPSRGARAVARDRLEADRRRARLRRDRADPRRTADARSAPVRASTSCASGSGSTASGCGGGASSSRSRGTTTTRQSSSRR